MSDPTIEEDSLISQEDIDKLLSSSSIEEAEEKLSDSDDDGVDELGELSQEDIDSLMDSNISDSKNPGAGDDLEDDDMELISQADIDSLMGASSQDISAAAEEEPDEDIEEISQEDILNLMGVQAKEPEKEDKDPDSLIVDAEIADSPAKSDDPGEKEPPAVKSSIQEDNYIIVVSESVGVQESLISQETINELIKEFDAAQASDPVILDEEPLQEDDPVAPAQAVSDEPADGPDEMDLQDETAMGDVDDFLMPDSDGAVLDFDDKGDEEVSQDDIDALLSESDDEEEEEEDILISQDDIDTLLMAADQEDEDVLGDLMDADFDGSLDDEDEDADILESDGLDESEEEDDEDQVVLQGDDEETAETPKAKKTKKIKEKKVKAGSEWYRSKLVMACASALIILGITVPITYFLFFSGGSEKEIQQEPVAKIAARDQRDISVETVDINVKAPPEMNKKPGNMVLTDFVILASDFSKDMTYITVDISIDYSDQRAYKEIQDNLSFYRDMIYNSLKKGLVSEKENQITEADILSIVETDLKKALPEQYVNRVSFKSFKAS